MLRSFHFLLLIYLYFLFSKGNVEGEGRGVKGGGRCGMGENLVLTACLPVISTQLNEINMLETYWNLLNSV
jgi:hypothetical protein